MGAGAGGALIALTGALMQVNVHGGGAATVYAAETGGTTVSNPLTSTSGRVSGWLDEGTYDLVVTYQLATAAPVMFNARAAYPAGATDGQVLTYSTAATSAVWSDANSIAANLPWKIDVVPWTSASTTVGTWTPVQDSGSLGGGAISSGTGAQNDQIGWDVILGAGTWKVDLVYNKGVGRGIYTVSLDGTTVGTVDGYAASTTANNISVISPVTVATTGKKRLLLKMATRNASNTTGWTATLQLVSLLRTA